MLKKNLSLAIHLHLYYLEMWEEIKGYLLNIGEYPYHLYVTLNQDNPKIIEKIKYFHPNTTFFIVANRGYDVGPFIYFLHQINLDDYDLIIKIHTKCKTGCDTLINHHYVSRKFWSNLLFEGILGSNKLFQKNIKAFEEQKDLGMVASKYLITSSIKNSNEVRVGVQEIMKQLENIVPNTITFVAGTMFIVRSNLLQQIKDNFELKDFESTDGTIKDGTLAHVLERVFGCLVISKGYKIKGFDKNNGFIVNGMTLMMKHFFYHKKITKSNYLLIKVCKIPVYHRKVA